MTSSLHYSNGASKWNKFFGQRRSFGFRYGIAFASCASTLVIAWALNENSIKINLTILVLTAVIVPSWFGGQGPGIFVSVIFVGVAIFSKPIPPPETELAPYLFSHFSVLTVYILLVLLVSSRRSAERSLRESEKRLQESIQKQSAADVGP